jgi:TonB family protein
MNHTQQLQGQGAGCSTTVAAMLAVLGLLVGLLIGAGGLFGFLKADPANSIKLGVAPLSKPSARLAPVKGGDVACPACPACPRCDASNPGRPAQAPTGPYALAYPIEETLRVEGDLDEKIIRDKVIRGRFDIQRCYQQQLVLKPTLAGEIALQFTVAPSGKILAAVARQSTTPSPELEQCVLQVIKAWSFDRKPGSKDAVVKFDILFAPLSGGALPTP